MPLAERNEEKFKQLLEARARRLGVPVGDVLHGTEGQLPRYLQAVLKRAADENVSPESILAANLERLRDSKYPSADCLEPHEVEQYVAEGLPPDRREHARTCAACNALLDAAQPDEAVVDEVCRMLARVAGRFHRTKSHAVKTAGDVRAVS